VAGGNRIRHVEHEQILLFQGGTRSTTLGGKKEDKREKKIEGKETGPEGEQSSKKRTKTVGCAK